MSSSIFCFDFDGTLIRGDIVSGLHSAPGLPEHLYSLGLVQSQLYPTFESFISDFYSRKKRNDTTAFELPYQIYHPSQDNEIQKYWDEVISSHFVPYTLNLLKEKDLEGQEIWIVSSSPTIYLQPVLKYLPINRIIGIEKDQLLVYGQGKREILLPHLKDITGYIGDNWSNDGIPMATIRNYNPNADLRFLNWGQLSPDHEASLRRYQIQRIDL